jgi:hypothetical protein
MRRCRSRAQGSILSLGKGEFFDHPTPSAPHPVSAACDRTSRVHHITDALDSSGSFGGYPVLLTCRSEHQGAGYPRLLRYLLGLYQKSFLLRS